MRRGAAIVIALGLALTAAGSASAAPSRFSTGTAQAFWHFKTPVTNGTYHRTTWYVGVYFDGETSWSDLYQEVDLCRVVPGPDRCGQESFEVGFSTLSRTGETFSMDTDALTTAHLEARYELQAYDESGNPTGSPERYSVVSDWTGVGDIVKSHGKDSWHAGCYHFSYTFKDKFRTATSTGSLNAAPLGGTSDAFLATDVARSVSHDCH